MTKPTQKILRPLFWIGLSAIVCGLDQWSKAAMRSFLDHQPGRVFSIIKDHLDLVNRHNTGGAFSLLDGYPTLFLYLPVVLMALILYLLIREKARPKGSVAAGGLSLILGGAAGNMVDRLRMGSVFDFIDAYVGSAHWPAFNMADSCIVLGVALFALSLIRKQS